jgi:hypothetical protein
MILEISSAALAGNRKDSLTSAAWTIAAAVLGETYRTYCVAAAGELSEMLLTGVRPCRTPSH